MKNRFAGKWQPVYVSSWSMIVSWRNPLRAHWRLCIHSIAMHEPCLHLCTRTSLKITEHIFDVISQCIKIQATGSNHFIHFPHKKFSFPQGWTCTFTIYYFQTQRSFENSFEAFGQSKSPNFEGTHGGGPVPSKTSQARPWLGLTLALRPYIRYVGCVDCSPVMDLKIGLQAPSRLHCKLWHLNLSRWHLQGSGFPLAHAVAPVNHQQKCDIIDTAHPNGMWSLWRAPSFCKDAGLSRNWTAIPPFSPV